MRPSSHTLKGRPEDLIQILKKLVPMDSSVSRNFLEIIGRSCLETLASRDLSTPRMASSLASSWSLLHVSGYSILDLSIVCFFWPWVGWLLYEEHLISKHSPS